MKPVMKKILAAAFAVSVTSSLFALDGLVRNSVFIFSSKVKDFSDAGIRQNVSDGRAVSASPLDLKVGDIFIDVNGHAKKVTAITRSGNNISISTKTPDFNEVFDGFNVPEQTADFNAAIEERDGIDSRALYEEQDESLTVSRGDDVLVSKTLLDTVMPESEGYKKWSFSASYPTKPLASVGSLDGLKKLADDALKEAKASNNQDDIKYITGAKKMIGKRESSMSAKTSLTMTPQLRYKSHQNEAVYSASYASAGIDKHGTWKVWKWTSYYHPGYVKYDWYRDSELGIGVNLEGAISANASWAIPGASFGDGSSGPYAGLFLEISAKGGISAEYQYYKRSVHHTSMFSNFNFVLIPSNTNAGDYGWEPDAHQIILCVNGNISAGPSVKAGLIFFGINLVELKASAGGKLSANVGGAWTKVNSEQDDYYKLYDSINPFDTQGKIMIENIQKAKNRFDSLEELDGWQLYGKASVGLYGNIKLSAIKGIISFDLLNINKTLWSATGNGAPSKISYTSPFGNGVLE